jgi:GTPase SAR1 family protein
MEVLAIPLALLVVSLVVKLVRALLERRRERAAAGSPAPATPSPTLPTFRVVALGGPGSGKTVFLSSLFHSLSYRTPGRSYHLETDAAQRVALGSLYRAVSDTSRPWPKGTNKGETREFLFDCMAADGTDAPHAVLRMGYLDYAGELIQEESDDGGTALADLAGRIDKADALLGMIDGLKVARLLRDEPAARSYFQHALQPMFGFMQNARCPIHLVVTKWDLVRDFGEPADADDEYRLNRVIEALLQYEHIRALVYVHSARQVVRLIPVSAVGAEFVDLDADGKVVKRPDGHMRPTNVEIPFCAVLPDLFRQVESSLDESLKRELDRALWKEIGGDSRALAAKVFARPAGAALRLGLQATLGRDLGTEASTMFVEWLARPFGAGDGEIGGKRKQRELHLAELQRLRRNVLDDFTRSVMRLEAALPNTQLGHAW